MDIKREIARKEKLESLLLELKLMDNAASGAFDASNTTVRGNILSNIEKLILEKQEIIDNYNDALED